MRKLAGLYYQYRPMKHVISYHTWSQKTPRRCLQKFIHVHICEKTETTTPNGKCMGYESQYNNILWIINFFHLE